jgi:hypothetical protein
MDPIPSLDPPTPGYKTTEFWLSLGAKLLGAAFAAGLIGDGTPLARDAGLAAVVLTSLGYTVSRGLVKASALLLVVGLAATTQLTACATVKADLSSFVSGAVTCAKADEPQAKALALQLSTSVIAGLLAGQDAATVWAGAKSGAEAAEVSQGLPIAACAFDGVLAAISAFLHPAASGTSSSALTARVAQADPLAAGKAALATFEAAHGVTRVVR